MSDRVVPSMAPTKLQRSIVPVRLANKITATVSKIEQHPVP
jgi:hypothetical protein